MDNNVLSAQKPVNQASGADARLNCLDILQAVNLLRAGKIARNHLGEISGLIVGDVPRLPCGPTKVSDLALARARYREGPGMERPMIGGRNTSVAYVRYRANGEF